MKSLTVKAIPSDNAQNHPDSPSPILPSHPFSMGIIAPKGSGKTTLLCNIIHFYKNYFHAIVIFSPTVNNDEKWVWVRKQKLLARNTKLSDFIKSKKRKHDAEEFCLHEQDDFDGTIPDEHIFAKYNQDDLREIRNDQQKLTDFLVEINGPQNLKNRILFIFDDLVGSSLFSNHKDNPFKQLNSNMRHDSASVLMVTQAYKEIPKTVRTQFSAMILFEIPSENEKRVIKEEYGMGMDKNQWDRVYKYCTEGDHSFLYYNIQQPKDKRVMKNFKEIINIKF